MNSEIINLFYSLYKVVYINDIDPISGEINLKEVEEKMVLGVRANYFISIDQISEYLAVNKELFKNTELRIKIIPIYVKTQENIQDEENKIHESNLEEGSSEPAEEK